MANLEAPVAVVLAAGLGSRLRAGASAHGLDEVQRKTAVEGLKTMVPLRGRPLLSYILDSLQRAGLHQAICVVRPGAEEAVGDVSRDLSIGVTCAVQESPRGTAAALCEARDLVGDRPFLVTNSDNLFKRSSVRRAAAIPENGLVGFRASGLTDGNIDIERVRSFAILDVAANGSLRGLIEKPSRVVERDPLVSMTLWKFQPAMWPFLQTVQESERGELEIPTAVANALDAGVTFEVVESTEPVLDLSFSSDIARLEEHVGAWDV